MKILRIALLAKARNSNQFLSSFLNGGFSFASKNNFQSIGEVIAERQIPWSNDRYEGTIFPRRLDFADGNPFRCRSIDNRRIYETMKKTTSSITFLLSTNVGITGGGENWWPGEKWPIQAIMTLNAGKQRDTDESIARSKRANLISDLTRQKMKAAGDWIKINRRSFFANTVFRPLKFAFGQTMMAMWCKTSR